MSRIKTELLRILQAKYDIKQAINDKGGTLTDELISEYATAINELPVGGDFYEGVFDFFGAETKDEKMVALNKITQMLLINGFNELADDINNYRDENDLWPETIILGVLGEPAELSLLTRYEGVESYVINPQSRVDGNYVLWEWNDTKWPWNLMTTHTDADGNVVRRIPKMWIKPVKDINNVINQRYISNVKVNNDYILPECFIDQDTQYELDYFEVGVYEGAQEGTKMVSKSGKTVLVDKTLNEFRSLAAANNVGGSYNHHLLDMHIKFVLETLYLIIFANTNSDELFPQGGSGSVQLTGVMDGMEHHTGYRTNLTNYPMRFLGIENYFSNTFTQVDGVKINNKEVFVADNPRYYNSDSNTTNYKSIGNVNPTTTTSSQNITGLGSTQGLFSIPITTSGAIFNTYYADGATGESGYRTLYFGRLWALTSYYGLFRWDGSNALGSSTSRSGARLVKKPQP